MGHQLCTLLADFNETQVKEFDKDVKKRTVVVDDPREALMVTKCLKEESNQLYRSKSYN